MRQRQMPQENARTFLGYSLLHIKLVNFFVKEISSNQLMEVSDCQTTERVNRYSAINEKKTKNKIKEMIWKYINKYTTTYNNKLQIYIFFSFTLHPAHSRVGRRNLVLRHFVLYFP